MIHVTTPCKLVLGVLAVAFTSVTWAEDADPVRALLLTGGHPYDVAEFHQMFDSMEGIEFTHVELRDHSEVFDDIANWDFDSIVFYNMTANLSDGRLANLVLLTEWGVGLVPMHHGTLSWTSQPFVRENIFGVQFPDAGAFGFHIGEQFTYNIVDSNHPITHGMADFDVIDESYTNYYGTGQPGNRVLIRTSHQPADPELMWVRQLNNSRIANIQGGHDRLMFENHSFAELIRRSVLWTAGRMPAELGGEALSTGSIFRNSPRIPAVIESLQVRTADDSRLIETTIEAMLAEDGVAIAEREQLVEGLVRVAKNPAATKPARSFALRQLGTHAGPAQIEQVATLLSDPEMGNMARYALEQIGHPRAIELLREAISTTTGDTRRGVVFSLGRLKDQSSRSAIGELLTSDDPADIEAAASALGLIGGVESVAILRSAYSSTEDPYKAAIELGMISAAESLPDVDSSPIYRNLCEAGTTPEVQAAAWRGLLLGATATAQDLEAALAVEDARIRDSVVRSLPGIQVDGMHDVLQKAWPSLSTQESLGVLYALEERGEPAGLELIQQALQSKDESIRQTAIYVAGSIGDRDTAGELIGMMADAPAAERRLMADALATMPGDGINELLLEIAGGSAAGTRADVIDALSSRGATEHVDAFVAFMGDEDRAVRRAAFDALSTLGGDREVAPLIGFIQQTESTPDRRNASRALIALVADSEVKEQHLQALMTAVDQGPETASEGLLSAVAALNNDDARDALIELTKSEHENLRLEAIRALSEWKDSSPMDALLMIARDREGRESTLSARGYLRLIASDPLLHREERIAAAIRIQPHLRDSGSKTQLIGLASGIPSKDSLDVIGGYLDDPEVQRDAVQGMVRVADGLWADYPDEVREALGAVIDSEHLNDELRAEARRGLDSIEKYADRLLGNWTFTDDLGGWEALNQTRLENVNGVLVIHCEGDDPFIGVNVEIPEQPMVIQFRTRYTDPQAFQFFTHTSERPITDPASVVSIVPEPSTGDWVDYEVNLDPKGTLLEFRFDPALKPGIVEVDYIRLLKR